MHVHVFPPQGFSLREQSFETAMAGLLKLFSRGDFARPGTKTPPKLCLNGAH